VPAPLPAHIAMLVADLDEAIERWSRATGYTFSTAARYRTHHYCDHSDLSPHFHDARIAISLEGPPQIELMEFTGAGTHSAAQGEGFHHFGFTQTPDLRARRTELAALGIGHDGEALTPELDPLLWFTRPADLNGVRLEFVGTRTQPIIADDGEPLPVTADGLVDFWPAGADPSDAPRIHHVALLVPDLEEARERWASATGFSFGPIHHYRTDHYVDRSDPAPHHHDARVSMSADGPPRIELMEFTGDGTHSAAQGEGAHHIAFLDYPDLEGRLAELGGQGIGDDGRVLDDDGKLLLWFTAKQDLNGIRFEHVNRARQQPVFTESGAPVILDPDR
jgi:catechol 2,3-dioxygenase-like lactoylglutathione lyase family enzyme